MQGNSASKSAWESPVLLRNIAISAFDPETTMYVSAVSLGSTATNRKLLEHWVAPAQLVILAQRVRIAATSTDATKV